MTEENNRTFHFIVCIVLVLVIVAFSDFIQKDNICYAESQPTAVTKTQALNWAKGHADKRTEFDIDGIYGIQCADFGTAYINYIISKDYHLNHPYTTYNGCMYYDVINREGWKKYSYKKGFVPEPGDILCWNENMGNGAGHVAVAIEGCTSSVIRCIDQSGSIQAPTRYSSFTYENFKGVVRPLWKKSACNCSTKYAGDYVTTDDLNMRNGHGTSYRVLDVIPKNTKVHVSKSDGKWAHVSYKGQNGYCAFKYLKKYQKPAKKPSYSLNVWFSKKSMGDKTNGPVFVGERYYLCYEIKNNKTGKTVDPDDVGKFTVKAVVKSGSDSGKELSKEDSKGTFKYLARREGLHTATVTVSGSIKSTESEKLNIYNKSEPHVVSEFKSPLIVGSTGEFSFDIIDSLTDQRLNSATDYWKSKDSYRTSVTVYDSRGNVLVDKTFNKADHGGVSFKVSGIGEYSAVVKPEFLPETFIKTDSAKSKEKLTNENISMKSSFTPYSGGYKITYSGKHINATPVVKDRNGKVLKKGRDYDVLYSDSDRKNIGRYHFTVKGRNNYTGTIKRNLIIVPDAPKNISSRLSTSSGGYDDIYTSWSSSHGAEGYSVYYKRSDKSKWSCIGTTTKRYYLKKNLSDGYTYKFKVVPYFHASKYKYPSVHESSASATTLKKVSISSVKRYNSSKVKVYWKNIKGESGYQISRSTSKKGTHIASTRKTTSGNYGIISASANKTYYYKVRAFKTVKLRDGTHKVYGPWSNVKSYTLK